MDLNADLGESYGHWTLGDDERLVPHLTSANLACGFHAGDFRVMEATVALCRRAGVAVGAQPGYPDLLGFGRRPMPFEPDEVESLVRYQIGALEAFCRAQGVEMQHVKPHGALYNQAATDPALASAIARAVGRFSRELLLFGLASSEPMASAAAEAGLRFVPEAFADRSYEADGTLHAPGPARRRHLRSRRRRRASGGDRDRWVGHRLRRQQSRDPRREHLLPRRHSRSGRDRGGRPTRAGGRRRERDRAEPGVIRPFGEAALLVETASADRAQALAADLQREPIRGVIAAIPGLRSLLVELDPLSADPEAVRDAVATRLTRVAEQTVGTRLRTIPVAYGGELGPDLPDVAALTGLSEAEVVERHATAELRVLFDGFAPGFAYLGDLPVELRVARLDTPRTRTPSGSVAIAGPMSGVYPATLPGGWRVIGRTPVTLFDPRRDPPAYLMPGDRVRFERIGAEEWDGRAGVPDDW